MIKFPIDTFVVFDGFIKMILKIIDSVSVKSYIYNVIIRVQGY